MSDLLLKTKISPNLAELFGMTSLDGALLLIILGAYLIVKPLMDRRKLFGKAEEG